MKERAFTLLCAMGALLLFIAMFVRRESATESRNEIPRPTTAERRGNGYHAALVWLNAEGIRALSLRERFDKLAHVKALSPTGNLLIVTLPAPGGFNAEEPSSLDRWIREGNTLLVLAALSDMPDWASSYSSAAVGDLNLLTGLEFETASSRERRLRKAKPPRPDDMAAEAPRDVSTEPHVLAEPRRQTLVPNRAHPYFRNVPEVVALSDYTSQAWTAKVPYQGFALTLARQRKSGEGALWVRQLGAGRIIVSPFGSLFTNRVLGLAHNGQLLANIVASAVQKNGAVLFDDAHQGLGTVYDPQQFYRDHRLYWTVAIVGLLWLVWVLGSTRLRIPALRSTAPREVELVRAAGGFFARVLPNHAAARRLFENFFRRLDERRRGGEATGTWELLERHPRVAVREVAQLKEWYARALAKRRVPLPRLYNLLLRLEKTMA